MKRAKMFGERVYLRPLEKEDIDGGWHEWINDAEANANLISPWPQTRESLEQYWEQSQPPNCVMFAICDRATDAYMGNARLSAIDWVHRTALYGRLIGREYQKKGFGTEALILLFRFGFCNLGLNRIWSTAWVRNESSLASNDKVGMHREGIMRQAVYKGGRFHDTVILAMLREDFDRLHGLGAGKAGSAE